MKSYRQDIDALKGIAIISVILYHTGILNTGYLGVDVFFVINGFFVIPSIVELSKEGKFSYFTFLRNKLLRMLPLIVTSSWVCILIGWFGLLPDHLKNLSETILAGNLFSENIFLNITSKDYWDISNNYKPLMHFWYVGVLFEFYIIIPLILWLGKKAFTFIKRDNPELLVISIVFLGSLIIYLLPFDTEKNKFFYIHYRLFELLSGGIIGLLCLKDNNHNHLFQLFYLPITILAFVLISSLFLFQGFSYGEPPVGDNSPNSLPQVLIQSKPTLLLLTVFSTCLLLHQNNGKSILLNNKLLIHLGKRSFSFFVWHQIVLVFYRYFVSSQVSVMYVVVTLLITIFLSELSYSIIEQKTKRSNKALIVWLIISIPLCFVSFWIHKHHGVVRDIPELSVHFDNLLEGDYSGINGRVFDYDIDFPRDNGKKNVLIIGNSFSRDIANCLLESNYKDNVNLSYIFELDKKHCKRIEEANIILIFSSKESIPDFFWKHTNHNTTVWGIGTKNYGEVNEQIYIHRKSTDYLNTTIPLRADYKRLNESMKQEWTDHYIDMIEMATADNGEIKVFTPDGKFISHDCMHLSLDGARWYASVINWNSILGIDSSAISISTDFKTLQ